MTVRETPAIQKPAKKEKGLLFVGKREIKDFLKDKELPRTKVNIRKARRKLRRQKKRALPRGKDVTYTQADAPWQIIYGTFKTGGIFSFMYINDTNKWLNLVVTLACHEINAVTKLFLDDKEVVFGATPDPRWSTGDFAPNGLSKVFMASNNLGSAGQAVQADLHALLPTYWTGDHKQSNRAHVFIILIFHKILFAEGMPDIIFEVQGKKVYDPRTGLTTFSSNTALCIADYLMDTVYGMGVDSSEIDMSNNIGGLEWASDICDEDVPLNAGGTEKRYALNGLIDASSSPQEILEEMASAMGGNVVFANGKWRFYPATYITPVITLTEDDLMDAPTINRLVSKGDIFNTIRGEYVSAENDYEVTDYPPSTNSTYVDEDGGAIYYDMPLTLTTSGTMAQRIAKIELEKKRRQITLDASWGLKAYQLNIGDTVMVTLSRYGFSSKVFEVVDFGFSFDNNLVPSVQLSLNEIDSGAFSWDETQDENAVTQAPATNLPNPNDVGDPTNLVLESGTDELYIRKDGTVFSRIKVSWDLPDDLFVTEDGKIQIQYKLASLGSWSPAIDVDGSLSFAHILDVKDGFTYDVRIRAVNGVGSVGAWVEADHLVIGKTEAPQNVPVFTGTFQALGVSLKWDAVLDLDIAYYELRRGGSDWATATFLAEIKGSQYFDNYQTAGAVNYWIKAFDTSGNSSATAKDVSVTILAPNPVTGLISRVVDNHIILFWQAGAITSFAVDKYKVYKGATFGGATLIGVAGSSFHAFFESVGGEYTYWITAVDTAGNESTEVSKIVICYDPPDFILRSDLDQPFAGGTFDDTVTRELKLLGAVDIGITWEDHFIDNGWTNAQDQIDDGLPYYFQPSQPIGTWQQEIDYGAILPVSLFNISFLTEQLIGNTDISVTVEAKEDLADPWTTFTGTSFFLNIPFRYVRITITFEPDANTDLAQISDLNIKVEVKKQTDGGNSVSDAGSPVVVVFNKDFIDVINIQVTPNSTSGQKYLAMVDYDWTTPDVDQFEVLIYNTAGTQVATPFSWSAEGIVRP